MPEESEKIGFFWVMEPSECFRLERRALQAGPNTSLHQSAEVTGKICRVLHVKVCSYAGPDPPVLSCDSATPAGCDNVCINLGKLTAARREILVTLGSGTLD